MTDLAEKKCIPCEGGVPSLTAQKAQQLISELDDWTINEDKTEIFKHFSFKNFYKTMAFVNAVAWVANQENHHPDMQVGYNYCHVSLKTHAVSGLTENDFIVAAKIDNFLK